MTWSSDELKEIVEADNPKVAPLRDDGVTYGTPTWIWCVAVEGALYVCACNGSSSRWFQPSMREGRGRILAARMTREVRFEPSEGAILDRIDEAYRTEYRGSPYLDPMISPRARAAIVRLVGAILLEQNGEWAVQRSRYITLESIAPVGDDPIVGLPIAAGWPIRLNLEIVCRTGDQLHHASGHDRENRPR